MRTVGLICSLKAQIQVTCKNMNLTSFTLNKLLILVSLNAGHILQHNSYTCMLLHRGALCILSLAKECMVGVIIEAKHTRNDEA